jgi:hypothetical protein
MLWGSEGRANGRAQQRETLVYWLTGLLGLLGLLGNCMRGLESGTRVGSGSWVATETRPEQEHMTCFGLVRGRTEAQTRHW